MNNSRTQAVSLAAMTTLASLASAADVSKPAILQHFDSSWQTIEKRGPDIFMAGYGAMWTPPPSRAESGNGSVGYDVYDRFDLGSASNYTQYGSERGLKAVVAETHRWGGRHYSDLILNHNGFATRFTSGFTASGGYPGFVLTRGDDVEGDFHQQNYNGSDVYLQRLSGLIDIAQEKNYQYIRNPVPGFANNLPAGTTSFFGKLANVANENNRRFYPDQANGGTTYFDPTTNSNVTLYDYNTANPSSGDPVLENAQTYMMRHARWMVQEIGMDGFRLDAVKHFPPSVLNEFDRQLWKSIKTPLLDGSQQHVFSFGEALDGNRALLQTYIKKNSGTVGPTTIGGNRDVLDFPLFFAMRDNLSSNGLANDWRNVVNAAQDGQDDGLANNGSQGVAFVKSHDDNGVTALPRVAHAYMLMRPGEAIVYFNANEFGGRGNDFPRQGQRDALGGFYGDDITTLVNIRNTHGRGNYQPRILEKELLAYEREKSAVVFLNNRGDTGFDTRTMQTSFAPGTKLIDLTGNATNLSIDPSNNMPDVVTVNASGQVTLTVKRNGTAGTTTFNDQGYVVYGLPTPVGSLAISNASTTLNGATPSAANNGTNLLTSMPVVKVDSFNVTLNTIPVVLPDSTTDVSAGGDRAYLKINGGINLNGNAGVDFVDPNGTQYGFENFITKNSPLFSGGDGQFIQAIDATQLAEGPNYIEARAYRQRSDGGPDVFTSFRSVVYVDRLAPTSEVDSVVTLSDSTRQFRVRSLDQTANRIQFLLNQVGSQSEAQVLATVGSTNFSGGQIDRDIFAFGYSPLAMRSGNQVLTVVTREQTGNFSVQRIPGISVIIAGRGLGVGDLDGNNSYAAADVNGPQGIEFLTYPNFAGQTNHTFGLPGPAADVDANGLLDTRDLLALRARYISVGAPAAAIDEARAAELRRANINNSPASAPGDAADIDFLYTQIGATTNIWRPDLNVDNAVTQADVDLIVRNIFLTEYGDANLDRMVNINDFAQLAANFNMPGGWALGNFNGDALVNISDFALLAGNFNFAGTGDLPRAAIPEPVSSILLAAIPVLMRRRN